jgi:H/ACA ribonucleoprotein complex subunit 2
MAKDKSSKEKKEKKEKRSESDGVKKSKKDKKSKLNGDNIAAAVAEVTNKEKDAEKDNEVKNIVDGEGMEGITIIPTSKLVGSLVPFANPLADEKASKKVLKSVKKGSICFIFLSPKTDCQFLAQSQNPKANHKSSLQQQKIKPLNAV